MNFFAYQHLLLLDLNSSGLFFYLAKDLQDLSSIDFSNLTLLKKVLNTKLCQENLLADEVLFEQLLHKNLKAFELEHYSLVFLLAPETSDLEKKAIKAVSPFLKQVSFVDRHFFYNFYLIQKRNFSKTKLIVNLFNDCAELSLFDQDKLLAYEKVLIRNLLLASHDFWQKAKLKFEFEQPDCFYFFNNNFPDKTLLAPLSKSLNLEAIEIDKLC